MSVKPVDYDALTTAVQADVIPVWQAENTLAMFPWDPIPGGLAVNKWAIKYLQSTQGAAWTKAGFKPNHVTMSFQAYKLECDTISQDMNFTEQDIAFYQANGIYEPSVTQLGENGRITANLAFWTGKDETGASPHSGQYNYVMDEGSGSGTAARPIMAANNASAGAWSTFANANKDLTNLIGGMEANGCNRATTYIFYPKTASPVMMQFLSEYKDMKRQDFAGSMCAGLIAIPDDYIPTDLGGTPTAPAVTNFDIFAIDISKVVIGYMREERVRIIPPYGDVRDTKVEFEVWPCPLFIPIPKVIRTVGAASPIATKYYKGVGMIDGVAQ